MGRTIFIGDLHGCYDEAVALLEKCNARPEDHVIFLGDLVDRGPDSDKCVDLAIHRERIQGKPACILGNHEEKHLDYEDIVARIGRPPSQMPPTHVVTRQQLKPHHYGYLRSLPLFIRIPEHNAVAVHAGVWPGRPIEKQTPRHLLHVQMINPFDQWLNPLHGKDAEKSCWVSRVPEGEGWKFWTHFWNGPEKVIFGHSVLNKPLVTEFAVGIDGGACFGLELWAYILPEGEVVSVKGKTSHANRDRTLHIIHDDVGTY